MGPQARGTTVRGTRRAQLCTVPGVHPPPPPGHWPRPPVLVASPLTNPAHTMAIPRPAGSIVGPATSGDQHRIAGAPSPADRCDSAIAALAEK
ncbi:hypothetical protein COCSUDRAFT_60272 [Coccomyxa subellipsoidea C-169]|uniref:Uncharacterized protein n=1 Tax=Coccomyxa subellipsoidea (strain C-169) TaxID=574566 RepID=I0YJP2_COCSC|nr:hypothetical protein COCSUDRAFT_60272 [Coccomyxa subellipsoidea C-169]EIE18611.1 hypothetical protein COCSUDRAFT_60272 [Coccomyxa subellipsoidea C-169]|eukprot:XP_005643155.1 hypothetical protein COCSUDRAFT_60272 [Coccomyxa subellipsoidea C-169]